MGFELSLTKIIHYVTALPSIYILSHDSVVHYCTINVCNIPTLNFL